MKGLGIPWVSGFELSLFAIGFMELILSSLRGFGKLYWGRRLGGVQMIDKLIQVFYKKFIYMGTLESSCLKWKDNTHIIFVYRNEKQSLLEENSYLINIMR